MFAGIVKEREDRYELKSPTLFIFGEKDPVIPLDQVRRTTWGCRLQELNNGMMYVQYNFPFFFKTKVTTLEAKLKDKCTVDFNVKVFPDQTHGFVHRKREDINSTDRPHIREAREDMVNWLNKYM